MADLYTKNGVPLKVRGDKVFNPSGHQFGRVKGPKGVRLERSLRGHDRWEPAGLSLHRLGEHRFPVCAFGVGRLGQRPHGRLCDLGRRTRHQQLTGAVLRLARLHAHPAKLNAPIVRFFSGSA